MCWWADAGRVGRVSTLRTSESREVDYEEEYEDASRLGWTLLTLFARGSIGEYRAALHRSP